MVDNFLVYEKRQKEVNEFLKNVRSIFSTSDIAGALADEFEELKQLIAKYEGALFIMSMSDEARGKYLPQPEY